MRIKNILIILSVNFCLLGCQRNTILEDHSFRNIINEIEENFNIPSGYDTKRYISKNFLDIHLKNKKNWADKNLVTLSNSFLEKYFDTAISPEWKDNLRTIIDSVNLENVYCTNSKNSDFDLEMLASNSIGYVLISHKQQERGIPGKNVILQFSPPCFSNNKNYMFLINTDYMELLREKETC